MDFFYVRPEVFRDNGFVPASRMREFEHVLQVHKLHVILECGLAVHLVVTKRTRVVVVLLVTIEITRNRESESSDNLARQRCTETFTCVCLCLRDNLVIHT